MHPTLLIKNGTIAQPGGPAAADLLCEGAKIVAMGQGLAHPNALTIDAHGLTLGPGFIDTHVHGGGGHSFFSGDPADVVAYAEWAPQVGVTSFVVSTLGPCDETTTEMLKAMAPAIRAANGAEPLGFHLEGPFLNPERCGAFHPDMLRDASREELWRFQEASGGLVRQVTFAPELPGGLHLAAAIVASGATAAMGHTDASVSEARSAFEVGVRHVTHLFNAMRPMHHRDGGAAAAALLDDTVTCELICDGIHVSPEMLRLAYRVLGPQRWVTVTDNLSLAGAPALETSFAGAAVSISGGVALRDDGVIAGSVATMDAQFRKIVETLGVDLGIAFRMCSTNPARAVRVADRKGLLRHGWEADLTLLDRDLRVAATICRGEVSYMADAARAPWAAASR